MRYEKILSVGLTHRYFSAGGADRFRFLPSADCERRMKPHKVIFRETGQGFVLLGRVDKNIKGKNDDETEIVWNIAVFCDDYNLVNYSDLDIDYKNRKIYYLSNQRKSDNKSLVLNDTVSGEEYGSRLLDWGADGVDISNFHHDVPFCILGLRLPLSTGAKAAAPREYRIELANRSVYWRYHVFTGNNGGRLDNIAVENNNRKLPAGINFKAKEIDETQKKTVFMSNKPVPMRDRGYIDIELKEKENGDRVLIPNLPNADVSTVRYRDKKWISDIFVCI
jgi:hypothetical protein